MNNSYKIFTILGIPIKIHISLILLFPLMIVIFTGDGGGVGAGFPLNEYMYTAFIMLGLFTSVALHELGHSFVGIKCGYEIREIVLLPIGGMAKIARMSTSPLHEILVALAGPAVSMLLAVLGLSLGIFMRHDTIGFFLLNLGVINLVLAVFNLVPSFPMDGGRVLRAALTPRLGALEATRIATKVGRFLAVCFGMYSLLWGHFWHLLIAIFIYRAAGAEYKMMAMRENFRRKFGFESQKNVAFPRNESVLGEREVTLSPPPYDAEDKRPN